MTSQGSRCYAVDLFLGISTQPVFLGLGDEVHVGLFDTRAEHVLLWYAEGDCLT